MSAQRFFQAAAARRQSQRGRRHQGFILIEFIVASAIGMIVLMAAGATYFTTQRLNSVSTSRLNSQQDLRTAANLIVRDARQAGNFGCISLGGFPTSDYKIVDERNSDSTNPTKLAQLANENDKANAFGIRVMSGSTFLSNIGSQGVTADNNTSALIFIYGDGSGSIAGTTPATGAISSMKIFGDLPNAVLEGNAVVMSSCTRLQVLRKGTNYQYTATAAQELTGLSGIEMSAVDDGSANTFVASQTQITRLTANAYLVGVVNGVRGLYRYSLADDGITWEGPQLLISGVQAGGMNIQFRYQNVENTVCVDASKAAEETFTAWQNTLSSSNSTPHLPALLRITLQMDPAVVNGTENASLSASAVTTSVPPYVIDAAIRGGNVCANRGA